VLTAPALPAVRLLIADDGVETLTSLEDADW
jgi:hypothetical protein